MPGGITVLIASVVLCLRSVAAHQNGCKGSATEYFQYHHVYSVSGLSALDRRLSRTQTDSLQDQASSVENATGAVLTTAPLTITR